MSELGAFGGASRSDGPSDSVFLVARNPEEDSKLPYLLRLPVEGGLVLKARETWPRASRVYCHPVEAWPHDAEIIERAPVASCRRPGGEPGRKRRGPKWPELTISPQAPRTLR